MNRRLGLLVGGLAIIAAACSSSGGSSSPASSSGASSSGAAGSPAASASGSAAAASGGAGCTVGVSWNNFQQPRWAAADKPSMKKTIEDGGGKFIDADQT